MNLTIIGRPIVKKNRMQLVGKGRKVFPVPSKAYKKFEKSAVAQIYEQLGNKPELVGYIHLDLQFFIMGKYHVDLDNLISSICDVLQAAGVVEDDDFITSITAIKKGGCSGWSTKISLEGY